MSLSVNGVTKTYGNQTVLDSISFNANKGEILGFLGPNGAGKTTTMKIVTGYTSADSGEVLVCGTNVENEPLLIKSKIGYLPEHNPLYTNMFVKEYLAFIARLHQIEQADEIIRAMIEQTGLTREQHKQIKMLSKGYRQRVGLAQALMHDPEVLILDEPTSGLDPNQLEDIRNLIKSLGQEKTVVFSSHIMQEVQALCDRVIIINHGKIVADDQIGQLEKYLVSGRERIVVEFENAIDPKPFSTLKGFIQLHPVSDTRFLIDCESELQMRKSVFKMAMEKSLPLIGLAKEDVTVENVFQALTK
jgi:ABC-2 type transport system ATP-binding protein